MADQPADSDQHQADVELAWSYAINADLEPGNPPDQDARDRMTRARTVRRARYARDLLHDLSGDADRLTAVAAACRTEHARHIARGLPAEGGYATAVHLAGLALDALRHAEAEDGLVGPQILLAELARERAWAPGTYRQGLWHRHSWPRRLLRRSTTPPRRIRIVSS